MSNDNTHMMTTRSKKESQEKEKEKEKDKILECSEEYEDMDDKK